MMIIFIVIVVVVVTSTRPSNAFHNQHNQHNQHQHQHQHQHQLQHRRFSNINGDGDDTICSLSQYNRRPLQHQHHPLRQSIVNKLRGGDNNNNSNKYNNKQSRQEETIIKTRGRGRGGTTISTSALMMTSTSTICGGGSGENGHDELLSREEQEIASASKKQERYRRRGMTIALMLGNFSVMGAKCALPSVLSLLLSTDRGLTFVVPKVASATTTITAATATTVSSIPQQQFAKLLGFSTFSIALGKLLLGPIIDTLGGIRALQVTLLLLTVMLATITMTQQFVIFAVCWVCVDFVFSSCWASCISSIQQSFPAQEWGTQIGNLATGARLGNAVSFSLFAAILFALEETMVQPWRVVFLVSTVLQIIPFGLLVYFGGMTIQKNQQQATTTSTNTTAGTTTITASFTSAAAAAVGSSGPTIRDSLRVLQTEARTSPEFWLHLTSRSCLMVFASFLLFVPTLMNQVYGCSNAVAAQVASAYSLGCLLSVSLGSKLFAKVLHSTTPPTVTGTSTTTTASQSVTTTQSKASSRKSIIAIVGLLSLATSSSLLQLGHATGRITLSWTLSTLSMFVWGFSFSLPFYLPSSLYALARGGRECSASIADCFDFVGFALLAFFNRYVASLEQHSNPAAWIGCFQITTACSVIAMITQSLAMYLEHQKKKKKKDHS